MRVVKVDLANDTDLLLEYKEMIDASLLESNVTSKSLTIEEFVKYLDLTKCIFMENGTDIIPFSIYNIEDEEIVVFHAADNSAKIDRLIFVLEKIGFDISNLVKRETKELLADDVKKGIYFIFNEQYYVLPQEAY